MTYIVDLGFFTIEAHSLKDITIAFHGILGYFYVIIILLLAIYGAINVWPLLFESYFKVKE